MSNNTSDPDTAPIISKASCDPWNPSRACYGDTHLGSNTLVEDSYIHHLAKCDGCHNDVLQSTGGTNITIRNNNLQTWNPDIPAYFNAAFQYGEESSLVRNCLVEGNLLNGGNYTINGGGGGTTGAACTFRGNRFQRNHRYKPAGNLGPNTVWESSNVWHDTGLPVR